VTSTSIARVCGWKAICSCRLSNSARSSGWGRSLKPLGEKRQPVVRGGEVYDSRRDVGRLGGEGVRVLPPFFKGLFLCDPGPNRRRGDGVASSASKFATWCSMRRSRSVISP